MMALGVLMVALVVLTTSCSSGDADTQPRNDVQDFGEGRFDEIPRFPRSTPMGRETEVGEHTARNFTAQGATTQQVLSFYDGRLEQWRRIVPVHEQEKTWLGEWQRGDMQLRVTAAPAPALEGPYEAIVQYSLELRTNA